MGRIRPVLGALVLLALACSPASAEFTPYSELRQKPANAEQIDAAVGLLSNSDIHGTLNRISALLRRSPIRNLPTEGGTVADTPQNFRNGMQAALADLLTDLQQVDAEYQQQEDDDPSGTTDRTAERFTILQLVWRVGAQRSMELHDQDPLVGCGASESDIEFDCGNPLFPIVDTLDDILLVTRPWVEDIVEMLEAGSGVSFVGFRTGEGFHAQSLQDRMEGDGIRDGLVGFGRAHGEPIIDP